jgi:O-antigen/teichoic acid export membrane protein
MSTTARAGQRGGATGSRRGSSLGRNIAILAGSQLVTWTLSLMWNVFVPRALGPYMLGELTVANAVTGFLAVIVSFGIAPYLTREIARDHSRAPSLVGTALVMQSLFVAPCFVAVAFFIAVSHSSHEQSLVLWLATGAMVLGQFTRPFQAAFQGLERMQYLAYIDILAKAVTSAAGIALVIIGFRIVGIMGVLVVAAAVSLLVSVVWSVGNFRVDVNLDFAKVRNLVIASLPFWTNGLVLTFYAWVDTMMLALMSSQTVVGWYSVPNRVFATLGFVPVIVSTAMLPRVSSAFRDGLQAVSRAARPAMELVLVVSMPVAVGVALIANEFVSTVFGGAYRNSVPVLVLLAFMLPPVSFSVLANQVLIAINRQMAWTKVMVGAAIVNPLLNLYFIRLFQSGPQHNGAIGAAISLLLTEIGMALIGLFLLPPILDASSLRRLLRAVLATVCMSLVVLAARGYGLVIEITAGAITFGLMALVLRVFTAEELSILRKAVERALTGGAERRHSTTNYHGWDDITGRPGGSFR